MKLYRDIIKPILVGFGLRSGGAVCRFHPSCSEYSEECFKKYNPIKAVLKSFWRILRCGPWSKGGIDLP